MVSFFEYLVSISLSIDDGTWGDDEWREWTSSGSFWRMILEAVGDQNELTTLCWPRIEKNDETFGLSIG